MSLAAPTRPLPSSPSSRTSDLPSRPSSASGPSRSTSRKLDRSKSSPGRSTGEESDSAQRDRERDKTAHRLSGQFNGNGRSTPNGTNPPNGNAQSFRIQISEQAETTAWGSNFWVTIQDPTSQAVFYACPSTGQTSWEPPSETFLMPLTDDGHWWELNDESRGGTPYYYHTKTGETQWNRPEGFVIPLGVIQTTTTLGRRLSQNTHDRSSSVRNSVVFPNSDRRVSMTRRSRSYGDPGDPIPEEDLPESRNGAINGQRRPSNEYVSFPPITKSALLSGINPVPLSTIPGSPDATSTSTSTPSKRGRAPSGTSSGSVTGDGAEGRASSPSPHRGPAAQLNWSPTVISTTPPQQSLGGAAELLANASREDGKRTKHSQFTPPRPSTPPNHRSLFSPQSPIQKALKDAAGVPPSPKRTLPAIPGESNKSTEKQPRKSIREVEGLIGRDIGPPKPDHEAAQKMNPLTARGGKPIFVEQDEQIPSARLSTGDHKILPRPLAADIEQFAVAEFAKRYFSTHKTGLIFKRRVPVEQMMSWQKPPLQGPLLVLNRSLHKDAVKAFKVIQKVMGDRDRDKPVGVKLSSDGNSPLLSNPGSSTPSLGAARDAYGIGSVLEEERWMLSEGLTHGELRDEIFCQVVKQLSNNPSPESTFHGWQLLCVLLVTFPPSKNFEAYLRAFMQERLSHTEGRIDIMAKYCISRLATISKKGPRGKPPSVQEIESAADAAFNPSTFGESLESIMRLQLRTYPDSKVPIILPFLTDSIIALGGSKREGIFRVPGDGDAVSEMKVRIDRGHYNLTGIDDPHVPASLMKMWLRELQEPLIPLDMYNECIAVAEEPEEIVKIVKKLPTLNRRALLFVISFLQLFLPESVSSVTKMTSPSLALVMAPNLLRCDSDSIAVVFNNSRFEHVFVHNLLLHLKCHKIDPDYVPAHGMGAGSASGSSINRPKSTRRAGS
ncbi:hypothetical protein FRB99_001686 [Tulasnella sp. 403]|nr:hypothetical protein FRB99_001686 [Tulasnella sp. 403]